MVWSEILLIRTPQAPLPHFSEMCLKGTRFDAVPLNPNMVPLTLSPSSFQNTSFQFDSGVYDYLKGKWPELISLYQVFTDSKMLYAYSHSPIQPFREFYSKDSFHFIADIIKSMYNITQQNWKLNNIYSFSCQDLDNVTVKYGL